MASEKPIPFPAQTARFKLVVKRCGQPEVHLTLVPVGKDGALQRLNRESRVMTVHQAHRGNGADYGMVGLFKEHGAQLLIFPKSLRRFTGKRIIGIDYSLLATTTRTTETAGAMPMRRKASAARAKPKPRELGRRPQSKEATSPIPDPVATEPMTVSQVLQKLQMIRRLLATKKYLRAGDETSRLIRDFRAGLEPVRSRRSLL